MSKHPYSVHIHPSLYIKLTHRGKRKENENFSERLNKYFSPASDQCVLEMICKEDVVSWFKELESYKRIDTMCTLLNMCLPFELRFLGTCLEELGRRDSQELRGIELRVNNPAELASDVASCRQGEPTDLKIRRKMALYLALIRACSRSCVNELFQTLDGWGDRDFFKFGDGDPLQELLLVYTMASNHPVFSFEQRMKCGEIYNKINDCNKVLSGEIVLNAGTPTTVTLASSSSMKFQQDSTNNQLNQMQNSSSPSPPAQSATAPPPQQQSATASQQQSISLQQIPANIMLATQQGTMQSISFSQNNMTQVSIFAYNLCLIVCLAIPIL